jgi:hypothetical protein
VKGTGNVVGYRDDSTEKHRDCVRLWLTTKIGTHRLGTKAVRKEAEDAKHRCFLAVRGDCLGNVTAVRSRQSPDWKMQPPVRAMQRLHRYATDRARPEGREPRQVAAAWRGQEPAYPDSGRRLLGSVGRTAVVRREGGRHFCADSGCMERTGACLAGGQVVTCRRTAAACQTAAVRRRDTRCLAQTRAVWFFAMQRLSAQTAGCFSMQPPVRAPCNRCMPDGGCM